MKKWTKKSDDAYDKKHGIKEGSKRDKALDKKRGIKDDKKKLKVKKLVIAIGPVKKLAQALPKKRFIRNPSAY